MGIERTMRLKRITLCVDVEMLKAVRRRAAAEGTSLDALFRRWLAEYVGRERQADRAMAAIRELRETTNTGGRKFTRDEMNER